MIRWLFLLFYNISCFCFDSSLLDGESNIICFRCLLAFLYLCWKLDVYVWFSPSFHCYILEIVGWKLISLFCRAWFARLFVLIYCKVPAAHIVQLIYNILLAFSTLNFEISLVNFMIYIFFIKNYVSWITAKVVEQ